jgi:isopentenyl-diphosphate delta-isomerase type 1
MDDQNELFVVVDEEDNVLEYRTRYDCHHDKSLIHRAVGVVILNDAGEILLQKRSASKDSDPGKYDVASSGHVGKGESYEDAAKREMKEEIGIIADIAFVDKMIMRYPNETEYDVIFRATHNGPFTVNKDEIDEVVFVTEEDIKDNLYDITLFAKNSLKAIGVL